MSYDAFLAAAAAHELNSRLAGRAVTSLDLLAGRDIRLTLGPRRDPAFVVFSLEPLPAFYGGPGEGPAWGDPGALARGLPAAPGPRSFVRLLEARLVARQISGIHCYPWERVVELAFAPREGLRGDHAPVFLVHEAAPKPARLIVLDGSHGVVSVWPPGEPQGRARRAVPGQPYTTPTAPWDLSPSDLAADPEAFANALRRAKMGEWDRDEPLPTSQIVLRIAPPLGKALATEVARRADTGGTEVDVALLHESFRDLISLYLSASFSPGVIVEKEHPGRVRDAAALPLPTAPGLVFLACSGAAQALALWHGQAAIRQRYDAEAARLRRVVRDALARAKRKVDRQVGDLVRTGESSDLRLKGEILLANLNRVSRGDAEVTLPDYEGHPVVISLDPRLAPAANAQAYFSRYRKAQRAEALDAPRRKAASEAAWLETVAFDLERLLENGSQPSLSVPAGGLEPGEGPDPVCDPVRPVDAGRPGEVPGEIISAETARLADALAGLEDIRAILAAQPFTRSRRAVKDSRGRGHRKPEGKRGTPGRQPEVRPLRYVTDDGLVLLAGRSARQNEAVSLKLSQPGDLWFHARNCPGSHVLLRLPPTARENPPERSMLQAAALAANLSPLRGGGKVSVDYTEARYLRRPRGAPPGLILYDPHQTIVVDTEVVPLPRAVEDKEREGLSQKR